MLWEILKMLPFALAFKKSKVIIRLLAYLVLTQIIFAWAYPMIIGGGA